MATSHIVVAFRMPPAGTVGGAEGGYLSRARSLCARGEALGGRLVAWSAALLAMAWDADLIEEALLLGTSLREQSLLPERRWSSGVAEGDLEPLAPDGDRMHLAWGEALMSAASLARIAKPGEMLVDGDMRAVRAGQLNLLGSWASTDAGQRVRGWRLDLEHPWKRGAEGDAASADATDRNLALSSQDESIRSDPEAAAQELSPSEVLEIVEASREEVDAASDAGAQPRPGRLLAERVRKLAGGDVSADAVEALADLRRARTRAEGRPPASQCQAALALAMILGIAGRPEEALLEALDALARAREAQDPKALGACMALLAKLYSFAGLPDEASALRESCGA